MQELCFGQGILAIPVGGMKAVSLFSGCGGFDLGVSKSGVDIIMANDIDHDAAAAYQSIFPKTHFVEKDVRLITKFPRADILIGCYPCTGFSSAARRRWKNRKDERDLTVNDKNFLFQEFLRAIDHVKPKLIFIENVRGMLSANNGYFLNQQLEGFRSRGFENIRPMILNAANYGVAQTRERVFFVGFHKRLGPVDYKEPRPTFGTEMRPHRSLRDVIADLPEWPDGEFFDGPFHGHFLTRNRKRGWDQPSFTVVADGHHVPLHPGGEPMSFVRKDTWQLNGEFNRRLSWRECLRIQGLPENMNAGETLWDKYRVVGNSVPPRLAQRLSTSAISTLRSLI
jgi:DNA (cytosine-5)-methyltransferase 1